MINSIKVLETPFFPEQFVLLQNYPNPFNPSTEINFDLPVESHVILIIYNVLGQEVDRLVDASVRAGSHTVTWDATNRDGKRLARQNGGGGLASGIYFYRLHATGGQSKKFNAVRKMMLVR